MTDDRRKSMLDVGIDTVEKAIRKGYVQAWFSWLGWMTVSSVIYVLGSNAHSFVVQALGGLSIVVTMLAGIVGVERLRDDWYEAQEDTMPRWKKLIGVLSIAAIGLYVIFELVEVIFTLTMASNGIA